MLRNLNVSAAVDDPTLSEFTACAARPRWPCVGRASYARKYQAAAAAMAAAIRKTKQERLGGFATLPGTAGEDGVGGFDALDELFRFLQSEAEPVPYDLDRLDLVSRAKCPGGFRWETREMRRRAGRKGSVVRSSDRSGVADLFDELFCFLQSDPEAFANDLDCLDLVARTQCLGGFGREVRRIVPAHSV